MSSIKKRKIFVDNISCISCEDKIRDELVKMNGIDEVQVNRRSGKVSVVYDLLKIDFEKIEQKIGEIGYTIHESFFDRLKDKYIHFTEENERDNINAPLMPCCSHPDNILKKKR